MAGFRIGIAPDRRRRSNRDGYLSGDFGKFLAAFFIRTRFFMLDIWPIWSVLPLFDDPFCKQRSYHSPGISFLLCCIYSL